MMRDGFTHESENIHQALISPMVTVLMICPLVAAILLEVIVATKSLSKQLQNLVRFV